MGNINPLQLMMNLLNPQQRQSVTQFQMQPKERQAEMIANYCNQNGISKEKLTELINMFRR